jgi:magnesium-transporting ATPase (P-type)
MAFRSSLLDGTAIQLVMRTGDKTAIGTIAKLFESTRTARVVVAEGSCHCGSPPTVLISSQFLYCLVLILEYEPEDESCCMNEAAGINVLVRVYPC